MQSPIFIIGAMEVEVGFLLEKIENKIEKTIGDYYFYEGTINSYPVVIAISKVGTIHASAVTALGVEHYKPLCIISQGTAGAIAQEVHKKDIVIGKEVFNVNSAKTPIKEEKEGSNSLDWDYITFVSGGIDQKITQKADEKLLSFFKEYSNNYKEGNVHIGVIGSGDIWDREKDRLIYFNKVHEVLCKEMETAAIYTVANENKVPVISIRVISDNELLGEPYDRNIGKLSQEFVYEAIKEMIKKEK